MLGRILIPALLALSLPGALCAQTPQQKTAQAAGIFAELCGAALPGMSGLEGKVRALSKASFANSGGIDQPGIFVQGGSISTGIGFSTGTPAWKSSDGKFFCQTSVFDINRTAAVDQIVAAFTKAKPASVTLTPVTPAPSGTIAAWAVTGARSGMQLTARRETRSGVELRLDWDK